MGDTMVDWEDPVFCHHSLVGVAPDAKAREDTANAVGELSME